MNKSKVSMRKLLVCVQNRGYAVSLEKRKIYVSIPDSEAARHRQVRVVDESGEDYLYPQEYFLPITLPQSARKAVLTAA